MLSCCRAFASSIAKFTARIEGGGPSTGTKNFIGVYVRQGTAICITVSLQKNKTRAAVPGHIEQQLHRAVVHLCSKFFWPGNRLLIHDVMISPLRRAAADALLAASTDTISTPVAGASEPVAPKAAPSSSGLSSPPLNTESH